MFVVYLVGQLTRSLVGVYAEARAKLAHAVKLERSNEIVRADVSGTLPVAYQSVVSGEVLGQALTLLAANMHNLRPMQPVPQTLTYSPHTAYRNDVTGALAEPPPAPLLQSQDFWSLYSGGQLPTNKFLLGHSLDDGQPVTATWRDLYSSLIGGQSGSGKSTLIRCVLAQSALQGGKFVVLDPHFAAGEESLGASLAPLQGRMMCDVAASDKQMLDALRFTQNIARARLTGDKDRTPIVLICDETTGLLQRSNVAEELKNLFGLISQESRKVGVYAFAIGQQWSSEVLPTPVRNSFVSMLSCRARRDVARIMSGSTTFGQIAETLTTGQAVWQSPSGEVHKLLVPNTTQAHLAMVAQTIDGTATTAPPLIESLTKPAAKGRPISGSVSGESAAISGNQPAAALPLVDSQRTQLVRSLVKEGHKRSQIIKEVWGADSQSGARFTQAASELDEIIRALVP